MNSKHLVWIVLAVVVVVATWQFALAQGAKEKPAPQKWEYIAIGGGQDSTPHAEYRKKLSDLGDEGWELVAVEPAAAYGHGASLGRNSRVFHLKRPK